MRFINCIIYFSFKDYTEKIRDFLLKEKFRSGLMTSARNQPVCKKI